MTASESEKKAVAIFTIANEVGYRVALGLAPHYRVRAVIQPNGDTTKSEALRNEGVDVIEIHDFTPENIFHVLQGCYACFLATKTVFTESNFLQNEIETGTMVVDQCKAAKIQHLVHLTHVTVEFSIGILARQNDAKEFIERQIRKLDIPSTGLILPVPYEVLLNQHKPVKISPNKYVIQIPMGETPFDGCSLDNVADFVLGILADGAKAIGKDYAVSAGKLTVEDMAQILTSQLRPYAFRDGKITVNEMRQYSIPGCEDIANMYEFMSRMDLRHNINLTRSLSPNLLDFERWVQKHEKDFKNVL